jgi:outer membrane protein assembly factor BamE (lipoprotein component of BamABCDE complex)
MKTMILSTILLLIILGGCALSGYKNFYKQVVSKEQLNKYKKNPDFIFLKDGKEPKLYISQDLRKDDLILFSKGYRIIGYSSFNGVLEQESEIIAQAKRIGAVLAIYKSNYTDTQATGHGALGMPKTHYHAGAIYDSGGFAKYGDSNSTKKTVASYLNTERRYDQNAWFYIFDKGIKKLQCGFSLADISRETRIEINTTGVKITNIIKDSPIYNSNLLVNDIIIKKNGTKIKNYKHILQLLSDFNTSDKCIFTILRNGKEKNIEIIF